MLGFCLLITENGSHLMLPKGNDAPMKISFRLYRKAGSRTNTQHSSFSPSVNPAEEQTNLGMLQCLHIIVL